MFRKYNYYDYEEAYYHMQWYKCKEIGLYLLPFINNDRARELEKELKEINYSWDLPQEELNHIQKVLFEVKVWIMVNSPC